MLFCMNCNIEYAEERKFCKYCGEPLIPKIESISTQKKVGRPGEEKSDGKLICPDCQIVYEFGNSCIQCGSTLVPKISFKAREELKIDHKKTSTNLICPVCKIIFERGKACIKCGSTLVPQVPPRKKEEPKVVHKPKVEEKPAPLHPIQKQTKSTSREKFICPTCKIIYERGNTCVRCGEALVAQISTKDQEKSESLETPEIQLEGLLLQNLENLSFEDVEQAPKKKMEIPVPPKVEAKEETIPTEIQEEQTTKRLTEELDRRLNLPRRHKTNYRRLSLEVGSITIMAIAGGYFLWSIYSYMATKEPSLKTPYSAEISTPVLQNPSPPTNATATVSIPQENDRKGTKQSSVIFQDKTEGILSTPSHLTSSDEVVVETLEIRKIKDLLENIRQANLQKNIDLFISCYASDFKDREGKKKATLAYWKKFDYLDLSYDLKNPLISGDTAKVKVEWLIRISSKTGSQLQENKTLLDVTLKKEEGGWKIKEVKQVG
jgi:rRNA maturation endonuclease Nob1/ketosteroid isomerase-like protein